MKLALFVILCVVPYIGILHVQRAEFSIRIKGLEQRLQEETINRINEDTKLTNRFSDNTERDTDFEYNAHRLFQTIYSKVYELESRVGKSR